jgi:DNA-binding XRE family transcriptional regulator
MRNQQRKSKASRAIACECGGELRPAKFDGYDFSDYVGLNVTVSNVDGFKCTKCGGETVDGSLVNLVMNYTIMQVAKSPRRLNGGEARYLRRTLHATQEELAEKMGIDRVTVADWERGANPISPQHDYILRGFALGWMLAGNLITPECMVEILGTVFKAVRRELPKKGTPSIALPDPNVMRKLMPPRGEMVACA